ncbi:DEAD/DEAH box helicase [Flavobacterium urumqiense]|jgi:type III restriction enzyme|uniref:Type III restriction enzyme n=1 Tax=Flavobacterium urumqiense TaxID=935224 RepID=A0A1H6AHQ3_9FLAO|nr:DEAD/DEAH box helicase family protein [Flavobacterium urumqiense]SEG47684.1 type III restriction enzyme [Flavobacterium urumqiense]
MELKPYQQQVINDLSLFLEEVQETKDVKEAFYNFWSRHPKTPLFPFVGTAIEPYKNNVPRVPHICVKVPTAGGKTFIACNAIKTIFDSFLLEKPKAVIWLVPSITILDQTIKNLKDPSHPYRQKINSHFGNKVEVFDKAALLQGSGFNATSIKEQLNILVFSFDSLRAKNKEDRKVFQENGNLQSFETVLGKDTDITLGAVIKYLNPLVIVDESHNAESDLSIDMLKEINPCFILDLTATPRNNSNIISFIDALELKKENMVKLPVIVYNHQDKTEVINSSLQLQRRLELQSIEEEKKGGKYIRPIVLFQAQPKNGKDFLNEEEEKSNVQKLKEKLIELKIPENQIKIKTANINEIKNEDLMSKECEVRFIITINALKEGWDCPFAYILSSLADKSSAVDVEQILGRVLRQPYVMKHNFPLLNLSYVLTASSKFLETLDNIVKGLNKAGFSDKDYKLANPVMLEESKKQDPLQQLNVFETIKNIDNIEISEDITADIDTTRISIPSDSILPNTTVANIEQTAIQQNDVFEKTVSDMETNNEIVLPNEIQKLVKTYSIKDIFIDQAAQINLPQFFLKVPSNDLFGKKEEELPLEKENLLEGFKLSQEERKIDFASISSELYKIDLDETKKEHTPTFVRLDGLVKESVMAYILDPSRKDTRVKNFTKRIMDIIGNMYPIPDKEIEKYLKLILEDFSDEQFSDFANNEYTYTDKIKSKIKSLSEAFAEQKFKDFLDIDKVFIKPSFELPKNITPGLTSKDITKSLYEKEGSMNGYEERVINEIGNMTNIAFWTRNIERKGFRINGFVNHYPDFIIQTKSGKTIVLETKGDHLDAEQKIRLGGLWASKSGNDYRYFMVYERRNVDGAYKLEEFLNLIKDI